MKQSANPDLPGKWPLKQFEGVVDVCIDFVYLFKLTWFALKATSQRRVMSSKTRIKLEDHSKSSVRDQKKANGGKHIVGVLSQGFEYESHQSRDHSAAW